MDHIMTKKKVIIIKINLEVGAKILITTTMVGSQHYPVTTTSN